MGAALDTAEAVQRSALEEARARALDAVAALRPFESHEGRVLPGIERAVKDAREQLMKAAGALAAIVALHLGPKEEKPAPEKVDQRVDVDLVERLRTES
ncbi:MAG: hypothetical protein AB7Q30_23230 [Vicinamibacteria bacterium]